MTKILLVEDDKALREIYGVRLLAEGYDIVSAGDGEEALTSAINEHPDLIISDVMMPKISGFEMIDLLRTNEKTRDIKVIVMSALGGESQKERGRQLGADRYLVKSQVGIEDVVATVKQVLAESRQPSTPTGTEPIAAPAATAVPIANAAILQPNQSAFNPVQATSPGAAAGIAQPTLPNTPLAVPTIMSPQPTSQPLPTTSTAVPQQPVLPTTLSPQSPTAAPVAQSLPPIPLPSSQPPAQVAPSQPVPQQPTQTGVPIEQPPAQVTPTPMPPSAAPSVGGIKVIQPTGVSVSPKINIDELLSKEEASEIAPGLNMNTNAPIEPINDPTISIGSNGVIDLDSATSEAASTFPANP